MFTANLGQKKNWSLLKKCSSQKVFLQAVVILVPLAMIVSSILQWKGEIKQTLLCNSSGHNFLGRCFCAPGYSGSNCERTTERPPACKPRSDECYVTQDAGIAVVDHQRWVDQQRYELEFWRRRPEHFEDNASPAAKRFDDYRAVPKNLGDVMEVGCGPFTQLNTILSKTSAHVSSVTLLDPLLIKYFRTSPNSPYVGAELPERGTHGRSFRELPTVLIQAPAEYMDKFHEVFDTVVMLNVLEHVTNAFIILQNIYNSLKPGGVLIFHERVYNPNNAT